MDLDQQGELFVLQLIDDISLPSPRQVAEESLADFAKQVWYGELDLVHLLRKHLVRPDTADEQRRRLLYVIDRLIRYPCILRSKAAQLRTVLNEWDELKPPQPTLEAAELAARHMLDKKAFEWGLKEDITPQMKAVLKYQTRHYAATLGRITGYTKLE
ncbi:hypothetical protein [Pseudomonas sp. SMN5]|uniref:hypothetical protein n=1 Tax=Pseudomonas sp. SMN5 TaxID=3390198 RepID=UPI003F86ADDD